MKSLASILAFASLAAGTAMAQSHFTGYIGGGPAVPLNPVAQRLDNGWNIGAGVGVKGRWAGLNLNFTFNDFGINRNALDQVGAPGGSTRIWGVRSEEHTSELQSPYV